MGNAVKAEAGEDTGVHLKNEPDSTATVDREEARNEPMKKKKKKQKKQNVVAVVEEEEEEKKTGASCKKSDGRGWHCKRRAQHPHSLCSYHLAQLRSYNASKVEVSKESHAGRKKQADGSGDDSDFYYYYSGFGPWRGKTRSSCSRSDIDVRGFALGVEDDDDDDEDREDNGIVYEVAAATIAGGDEEEGSDVDNGGGGGGDNRGYNASRNASNRGNYKSFKKRGRKRMKARSLKSLL